ncbi:MAG TPA: ATP-binding protein [Terriglobales bacterium]|nr:ATP-binding protein [Terriglobales bacterium]
MFRISFSNRARLFSRSSSTPQLAAKYALGVLAGVTALLLREVLNPWFAGRNPYHTAWLALVFSAWYLGIGPSILSVVISGIGIWYRFLPPFDSFVGKDTPEIAGMLGFLIFSAVIIALGESTRRSILKREKAEEELRAAREELEHRVKERTAALEQRTAEVVEKATMLDLANDAIFVKTAGGRISYWNQGAVRLYGWRVNEVLERTPFEVLQTQYPIPLREIESHDTWEGELVQFTRDGRRIVVASRWTALRDESGKPAGWMEINTDITGRKRAEEAARRLTGRILNLQDDERRRMARGLHDSLGQYLAALKMHLEIMPLTSDEQAATISQCTEIVDRCLNETRTVSHLLHPPLLDEAGFGSAARWYVEGFGQRSGINVNLDLPPDFGRLHDDVEIALFRALQEGLTNVHKHSSSSAVEIRLELDDSQVQLEIQDNGLGMSPETLRHLLEGAAETGIGIAGMRERARELGGSLEIESNSKGTLLRMLLPLSHATDKMQPGRQDGKHEVPAA